MATSLEEKCKQNHACLVTSNTEKGLPLHKIENLQATIQQLQRKNSYMKTQVFEVTLKVSDFLKKLQVSEHENSRHAAKYNSVVVE